jgi:ribonuclease HI
VVPEQPPEYAVLRHDSMPTARGKECFWVITRRPIGIKHQPVISGSFISEGMTAAEAAQEVIRRVNEQVSASGENLEICVPQKKLASAVLGNPGVSQGLFRGSKENPYYLKLGQRAASLLAKRKTQLRAEMTPNDAAGEGDQTKANKRTVYVDASMTEASGLVGAGYVIKDVYANPSMDSEHWALEFGSLSTKYMRNGGSTHAELSAINAALRGTKAINSSVRHGEQSLVIISDSKYAIEILNWLRYGTEPTIRESIMGIWKDIAEQILFLLHDVDVEFEWVKGHSDDLLNSAADSLAMAIRKSIESPHRNEEDIQFYRGRIVSQTVSALNMRGIKTEVIG